MKLISPKAVKYVPQEKKENKKNDIFDSVYKSFASMHSKIKLYRALFFGHGLVGEMFQSNTKNIHSPAMPIIDELVSYIRGRMRMPSITARNKNVDEQLVSQLDLIVSNIYIKERAEDAILSAWKDFMICGVGIIKINEDSNRIISLDTVSPSSSVWDTANTDTPQYFIHEEILSNDVASRKYGIDQVEYKGAFERISEPKILYSQSAWEIDVTDTFAESSGKVLRSSRMDSIYSKEFTKKMVYEKPQIGSSVIRHQYRSCNTNIGSEVKQIYSYSLYLNDVMVGEPQAISVDRRPFIILCNRDKSSHLLKTMYPCFLDRVKGDILEYNILSNTQMDCFISAAAVSGVGIVKDNSIVNGPNTIGDSTMKLNLIKVKAGVDDKIDGVMTVTPPADISQSVEASMMNCLQRIRSASGLLSFDQNSIQSGYHESLRLDREFSNISTWLTQIDKSIITIGERIAEAVGYCFEKEVSFLRKYVDDFDSVAESAEKFVALFANGINYDVSEMPSSDSNKQKIVASLKLITEITGDKFPIEGSMLADLLQLPKQVSDMIKQTNIQDTTQGKMAESEINKNTAVAAKDIAMAEKYIAESKEVKSEHRNRSSKVRK